MLFFQNKTVRFISYIVIDAVFAFSAWFITALLHTYFFLNYQAIKTLVWHNAWFIVLSCVISFCISGVYRSMWLYPSFGSFIRLGFSAFLSSFSVYVWFRVYSGYWQYPSVGVIAFYLLLTFSLGFRVLPILKNVIFKYFSRFTTSGKSSISRTRVLIIGAGSTAVSLVNDLVNKQQYKVVGFVDSDARKKGLRILGAPVFGTDKELSEIMASIKIDQLIIAVPSMSNEKIKEYVSISQKFNCKIKVMKSIGELVSSPHTAVRDLDPQDLLSREETVLDSNGIQEMLAGKTILVTGGGGSIGSEICRQCTVFSPKKIVIYELSENNAHNLKQELLTIFKDKIDIQIRIGSVQDISRLNQVFTEFQPEIVFHCAAFKHVPLMEDCPRLALENNVFGTYNTAMCAEGHNVKRFVLISSDKAVNPTNIMGATKRLCEKVVLSLNCTSKTEFVCVRFGNVLGSNGSVIPIFKQQIEAGGPVTLTDEKMTRYFMTIPEASRLVIQAAAMAKGGETFILDMGQPVLIKDLAYNMIKLAGFTPDVDIKIEYIGLRPGEKLYEELTREEEGVSKTSNNKIFVAKQFDRTPDEANLIITTIRRTIKNGESTRNCVHDLLPEFSGQRDGRT